ncbi:fungal-specific transcription factor domain-containing protein [Mycena capillaripes]|nr:fungal-specific transcription factor domain-containing protein [Mycena capillaripes]
MERLLTKLLPGIDFTEEFENLNEVQPLLHQHAEILPRNDEDNDSSEDFKLDLNPENTRFFGKSSRVQLVQTAVNFQKDLTGVGLPQLKCSFKKREEFWTPAPWILPPAGDDSLKFTFPAPDLLQALVGLYFNEVNLFWPILHRPTFDRKVADKIHLHDARFGSTLLMVCSLGARHCNDPRVLLEDVEGHSFHSAGWKWYSQVRVIRRDLIYAPDLYELQTVALSVLYIQALSPKEVCPNEIGFGLRRAQDVGAHRRSNQNHPTAENEQWKRVFWVLLCLDRIFGTFAGRPLAMHDQDFDQDLPIEVDDEYWDLPEPRNFKQPQDQPSDIAYFICHAKLLEIQAAVTIAIYSPKKPRNLFGHPFPPTDAQCIVAFDSALNYWLSNVPEHLRWDPDRKNKLHMSQSTLLYTAYHNVQILVHRPFIPAPLENSQSDAFPSLAICTNAARSVVRIFDNHVRRGIPVNFYMLPPVFTAGIVLLLNAWKGQKIGFVSKDLNLVYSCIRIANEAEERHIAAGRYVDFMNLLLHAEEVDPFDSMDLLPPPSAPPFIPRRSFDTNLDLQWPSKFVQPASDELHVILDRRLDIPEYQSENGLAVSPGMVVDGSDGSYNLPNRIYDFEQPTDMDKSQFPAEMAAIWSTVPASFDVEDWSYIMAKEPQLFEQFSSAPGQTYIKDSKQDEEHRRELSGF